MDSKDLELRIPLYADGLPYVVMRYSAKSVFDEFNEEEQYMFYYVKNALEEMDKSNESF